MRHNRSVNTDALRQGAARRRWKSCAARPLAATRRLPSRYTDVIRLAPLQTVADAGVPCLLLAFDRVEALATRVPQAARTIAGSSLVRPGRRPAASRPEVGRTNALCTSPTNRRSRKPCCRIEPAGFGIVNHRGAVGAAPHDEGQRPRHNMAVDADAQLRMLPAVAPVGRRSPLR